VANLLIGKPTRRSEGTRIACLLFFYPHDIPMGYENEGGLFVTQKEKYK
jgi:hypothetical protein